MKGMWKSWRGGVVGCLAGVFLAASLGCNAANNTGAAPSTNKTSNQKPAGKRTPNGIPGADPG